MSSIPNHANGEAVLDALRDPAWDFRTVEGIANESGMSRETIEHILSNNPALIRQSCAVDSQGRRLFALRSRPVTWRERFAIVRMYLTDSVC